MKTESDYVDKIIRMIDTDDWIAPCNWYQHYTSNVYSFRGEARGVPRSSIPANPVINNLDSLLHDVYLRYVAINDEEFEYYYNVVQNIFLQMHAKMKEVDPYYKQYSSNIQFVGSHPDRLRINKPDEFDIDIVMKMPLSFNTHPEDPSQSDFLLEPSAPGFINLKMGKQYQRLPIRDSSKWSVNKRAYQWKDGDDYLLRSKFLDWFKGVVNKALNQFVKGGTRPVFYVAGIPYTVRRSESGPAMTMYIENEERNFKLDVDLVLGLRFPIDRWPGNDYSELPMVCLQKNYWMLVPKPCNSGSRVDRDRSWRVAMHEQERMMMHNTNHMKQAIRLMKKLRDAQNMNKIASYYIKTLFFWEVRKREHNRCFWNNSPATLFRYMLKIFHSTLVHGYIPYFWNPRNNLLENIDRATLNQYAKKVKKLIDILENPVEYKQVAKYLLTKDEYKKYNDQFLNVTLFNKLFNALCKLFKLIFIVIFVVFLFCVILNGH